MYRFIKYTSLLILFIVAILIVLDLVYTKTFQNSIPRNKTQYVLSQKNNKFDYVFLGSSRVENTVMTSEIERITYKRALNLGTQGAKLDDLNIFLRLLIANKNEIKKLFIQIDYIYNFESSSDIVRSESMPFIRTNKVINTYLKRVDSSYNYNYYIPFYRYLKNDYKIGFREFFNSLRNKKSKINFEDGFVPIYGSSGSIERSGLPETILENNKSFNEIDSICRANNIKVVYFTAPFCFGINNIDYINKLKLKIPELKDFSQAIKEDKFYKNCGHLNSDGAKVFTHILINELAL